MSGTGEAPVIVVGGGLAGLAAAEALARCGRRVVLLERRRTLGGRATSYLDPGSGETIDFCQHVGLGCCTNFLDLMERLGLADRFRRDRTMYFFGRDGAARKLEPSRLLPAPLHFATALDRLGYLSAADRRAIRWGLLQLVRNRFTHCVDDGGLCMADWLRAAGQSDAAIRGFWEVVLVSALGETLDRVGVAPAQKVFRDAFFSNRGAGDVLVPLASLSELFSLATAALQSRGVEVLAATAAQQILFREGRAIGVRLADGRELAAATVVSAVPWRRFPELIPEAEQPRLTSVAAARRLEASPITGVHLWYDRPLTRLPHAVLVDRVSQWVFNRGDLEESCDGPQRRLYYHQVVVSASRELAALPQEEAIRIIDSELKEVWPESRTAELVRWKLVTEREAVFTVAPGSDAWRPAQATEAPGLFVAGDWTATGWPATMEGAVRSGRLAAEAAIAAEGRAESLLVADLPVAPLAKLLLKT